MALPRATLERLLDPATPTPPVPRHQPRIPDRALPWPVFDGMIFARAYDSCGPHITLAPDGSLGRSVTVRDEASLRCHLLEGIHTRTLCWRGGDPRAVQDANGALRGSAFYSLGNDAFEVSAAFTWGRPKTDPRRINTSMDDEEYPWLAFLLDRGPVEAALDCLIALHFCRFTSEWAFGDPLRADSWTEWPLPDQARAGLVRVVNGENASPYLRIGTAPDGFRPLVLSPNNGWVGYLNFSRASVCERWTQAKAAAHRRAAKQGRLET